MQLPKEDSQPWDNHVSKIPFSLVRLVLELSSLLFSELVQTMLVRAWPKRDRRWLTVHFCRDLPYKDNKPISVELAMPRQVSVRIVSSDRYIGRVMLALNTAESRETCFLLFLNDEAVEDIKLCFKT